MSKKDNTPTLDVRISRSWVRLITWIQNVMPDGEMSIKFVNGQPVKPTSQPTPDIRFDKESRVPDALPFQTDPDRLLDEE